MKKDETNNKDKIETDKSAKSNKLEKLSEKELEKVSAGAGAYTASIWKWMFGR